MALALGGGAARGFAHVGVVRVLEEAGIEVASVSGTSIGSVVGAAVAAQRLDAYEADVRGLRPRDLVRMLDPRPLGGGLFAGRKLIERVRRLLGHDRIEDLPLPYQAVTVDLDTGEEVRLDSGSLADAMRASCAIPGLFHPVEWDGRWLVDGGLASPVPIAASRAGPPLRAGRPGASAPVRGARRSHRCVSPPGRAASPLRGRGSTRGGEARRTRPPGAPGHPPLTSVRWEPRGAATLGRG